VVTSAVAEVTNLNQDLTRDEYGQSVAPARALAAEALTLERTLSDPINQAYSLIPTEIALMWQSGPA
jgi:hypothetical protein